MTTKTKVKYYQVDLDYPVKIGENISFDYNIYWTVDRIILKEKYKTIKLIDPRMWTDRVKELGQNNIGR